MSSSTPRTVSDRITNLKFMKPKAETNYVKAYEGAKEIDDAESDDDEKLEQEQLKNKVSQQQSTKNKNTTQKQVNVEKKQEVETKPVTTSGPIKPHMRFVQLSDTTSFESNKLYQQQEQFSKDITQDAQKVGSTPAASSTKSTGQKKSVVYTDEVKRVGLGRRSFGNFNEKLQQIQAEMSGVPKQGKSAIDELDEITDEMVLKRFQERQERDRKQRLQQNERSEDNKYNNKDNSNSNQKNKPQHNNNNNGSNNNNNNNNKNKNTGDNKSTGENTNNKRKRQF